MYRQGRKQHKKSHWKRWTILSFLTVGLTLGGGYLYLQSLGGETEITQANAVTTAVDTGAPATRTFDTPAYTIDLPTDWKQVARTEAPYNLVRFQSTDVKNRNRFIEIYQDTIPQDFPINRVVAVETNENKLRVPGSVSENCKDFTPGQRAPGFQGVPAKWQGLDFVCDVTNFERNVTGTSSKSGLNKIALTSPTGKQHAFFFVYTENAIQGNYTIFYDALKSFVLK